MTQIQVARPTLGEEEAAAARRAILSGWVVQGPEVAAFEKEFAALVGAPLAVACSSGTAALHLALAALDLGPGDEVITVSHSFIATANAVRYTGAIPVFVDVEYATGNINPDLIEAAVTPRTRAILAPHQLGIPCDLDSILPLAEKHNLKVVEDAACAIGSEISLKAGDWEPIGRPFGDLATFSFHPRRSSPPATGAWLRAGTRRSWPAWPGCAPIPCPCPPRSGSGPGASSSRSTRRCALTTG